MSKLWGGRFTKTTDLAANHFHSSISFDKRLYACDIEGSIAHAKMLSKQLIISNEDSEAIIFGLKEILSEIENGDVTFDENAEDIHMNIETLLIAKIGEAGKKLHTGRSRNDQVALDIRIYLKKQIQEIRLGIKELLQVLLELAKSNVDTILPGYTHLQKAQPITLSHHLLAYFEMFKRDYERMGDCYERVDVMPLGSGALASTTYPIDRLYLKELLGFNNITANSLDAVSDRDFCIEYLSGISIVMMHLSRFCEEIIIWSTNEFQFIELDDAYSTGSSIMPQKKNPDMAELIRGKTGRVYGSLVSLLVTMKSLPLAYNKDMQEDKEQVFDATDTIKMCLPVFTNMIKTAVFKKENMYNGAKQGFMNATDAADFLVTKGVAFRDAHEIVGKLVLYCIQTDKDLLSLTLEEYKRFSDVFTDEVYSKVSLESCVNRRAVIGGTAKERQLEAIECCADFLKKI